MSCALTSGYSLDCKDSSGGITEVYFIEKANVSSVATASGVVTALTKAAGKRFWKYELPKESICFQSGSDSMYCLYQIS